MTAPFFAELAEGPSGARAVWITASDGVRLRLVVWPSGGRGTVLIFPGRTEYAEKYGRVAATLAGHGFAAAAIDWRGQGLSDRLLPDRAKGHVDDFAAYQRDVSAYVAAVAAMNLPGRRFLLTHSMGGAIGLRALLGGLDVGAAAFSAPMWGINLPANPTATRLLATALTAFGLGARFASPKTAGPESYAATAPFADNLLTSDAATFAWMQAQLSAHPDLVLGGPTMGWVGAALRECRALAARPGPALPVVIGLGGHERIVDRAAVETRAAQWPSARLIRYSGAEHELLMEKPATRDAFLAAVAGLFSAHH